MTVAHKAPCLESIEAGEIHFHDDCSDLDAMPEVDTTQIRHELAKCARTLICCALIVVGGCGALAWLGWHMQSQFPLTAIAGVIALVTVIALVSALVNLRSVAGSIADNQH